MVNVRCSNSNRSTKDKFGKPDAKFLVVISKFLRAALKKYRARNIK
jgi:hypothetical protein